MVSGATEHGDPSLSSRATECSEGVEGSVTLDGTPVAALCDDLGLAAVHAFGTVPSTQDVAHDYAASGARAGTLVVTDAQTAGRGRLGRTWRSESGAGVWFTLIERPSSLAAVEVLSLRVGLSIATALDAVVPDGIMLKWPNDLIVRDRKLGGILIEARWRDGRVEWVAIGVGINLIAPVEELQAIGLGGAHSRVDVLRRVVPAVRDAARRTGPLDTDELEAFARRDWLRGKRCRAPVAGIVSGIDPSGTLVVQTEGGPSVVRAGTLVLAEES